MAVGSVGTDCENSLRNSYRAIKFRHRSPREVRKEAALQQQSKSSQFPCVCVKSKRPLY
jgi:hypothetical protein